MPKLVSMTEPPKLTDLERLYLLDGLITSLKEEREDLRDSLDISARLLLRAGLPAAG